MTTRRMFLVGLSTAGILATVGAPAFAADVTATTATALTRVYGNGLRFVAVAIEYSGDLAASDLSPDLFAVEGRTVTEVYPSTSTNPDDRSDSGRFVIVELSADDTGAILKQEPERSAPPAGVAGGGRPKWAAGDYNVSDATFAEPAVDVAQGALLLANGGSLSEAVIPATTVRNLVLDDFEQRVWNDPETGKSLPYNLFIPRDYDPAKSYPLVNFMHDAGATSLDPLFTLKQGLGAICWATPEDQAKRPCFVIAPQFAEIVADDKNETSDALDTTINLIKALAEEFNIDTNRLYTTGQSGGGMLSIAMNIKYPDFFAASLLVACQWGADLVAPMAGNKLFIVTSQDDFGAFPGQNAVTEALEDAGTTVARAIWDAQWSAEQVRFAFDDLDAEGAPVNYVTYAAGSVFLEGETTQGASGHMNTWRYAYTLEPVRDWIFRQSKA